MKTARTILMVLILAGLAIGAWWLSTRSRSEAPVVSGTIETDQARVASRYGGRVVKIFAVEGDALLPDQLLVELDAAELQGRHDNIAALLAELEHGPRTNEIAAAKAEWEALAADLDFARAEARRAAELFAQKVNSVTERDNAASRASALEQRATAAQKQYALLVEGTRPERLAQARAQLAEVDAQRREMQIVAPTNAVLETLSVKVGDVVAANREVATLSLPQNFWLRVYVPQTWLGVIQLGQRVPVRVDALPGREFSGVVEQINREAEFTPRNAQTAAERVRQVFGVKLRLPGDTNVLRAGMTATALFANTPPQE